jgi:hypothetical protein
MDGALLSQGSMKVSTSSKLDALKEWSERRDLNSGPLAPHASALPDCATLRRLFLRARQGASGVLSREPQ